MLMGNGLQQGAYTTYYIYIYVCVCVCGGGGGGGASLLSEWPHLGRGEASGHEAVQRPQHLRHKCIQASGFYTAFTMLSYTTPAAPAAQGVRVRVQA
jgi:hypothetical protein